jgi:hypothetical protein
VRLFGFAERAFNSNLGSWAVTAGDHDTLRTPADILSFLDFGGFISSPQTWIGALAGAALIFAAIQLRMRRTEI